MSGRASVTPQGASIHACMCSRRPARARAGRWSAASARTASAHGWRRRIRRAAPAVRPAACPRAGRSPARRDHDRDRIQAQHEADDHDRDAEQRPVIHSRFPGARMATPSASSALRSPCANSAAIARSPQAQRVGADRQARAVAGDDAAFADEATDLRQRVVEAFDHRARRARRGVRRRRRRVRRRLVLSRAAGGFRRRRLVPSSPAIKHEPGIGKAPHRRWPRRRRHRARRRGCTARRAA